MRDDQVHIVTEFDDTPVELARTWPISDHPYLVRVLSERRPVAGPLSPEQCGPTVRANLMLTGTTHGAWIPVAPNGVLHGILGVKARGQEISPYLVQRAIALARILELALANTLALESTRQQATTDALTGLANRRGVEAQISELRGRRPFAVLVTDVDRLKEVNDAQGHPAGDERSGWWLGPPPRRCAARTAWPGWAATSSWPSWSTPTRRTPAGPAPGS